MVGVSKLCTSEDTAVGNRCLPASGNEDMVNGFFGLPIGAVPGPVMDPLSGEPRVGSAGVDGSAEVK